MSFTILEGGKVEFQCRGCPKKAVTKGLHRIPNGWYVTGVLQVSVDPEAKSQEDIEREGAQRISAVGPVIGAHFHTKKCATTFFKGEKIREQVENARVTLALYGECEIVVDGAQLAGSVGTRVGEYPDGEQRGSPPPFQVGGDNCPI
jgi:hypothetical protein